MEIHKPHAAKTWTEFLIELGTIVAGILIALLLEQLVEHVRWEHAVSLGRDSLRKEIGSNNVYFAYRKDASPCVDRHIAETGRLIERAGTQQGVGEVTGVVLRIGDRLEDSQWQSERAAQILTHFPRSELAELDSYYTQLTNFQGWISKELDAWAALGVLENGPKSLSSVDIAAMRLNLEMARRMGYLISLNANQQLEWGERLGAKAPAPDLSRVTRECTEITVGRHD